MDDLCLFILLLNKYSDLNLSQQISESPADCRRTRSTWEIH